MKYEKFGSRVSGGRTGRRRCLGGAQQRRMAPRRTGFPRPFDILSLLRPRTGALRVGRASQRLISTPPNARAGTAQVCRPGRVTGGRGGGRRSAPSLPGPGGRGVDGAARRPYRELGMHGWQLEGFTFQQNGCMLRLYVACALLQTTFGLNKELTGGAARRMKLN